MTLAAVAPVGQLGAAVNLPNVTSLVKKSRSESRSSATGEDPFVAEIVASAVRPAAMLPGWIFFVASTPISAGVTRKSAVAVLRSDSAYLRSAEQTSEPQSG